MPMTAYTNLQAARVDLDTPPTLIETIGAICVVGLTWIIQDSQGEVLDELDEPAEFLIGAQDLLPKMEIALKGKRAGQQVELYLEPQDGFGHYDENHVLLEPRACFPKETQEGMIFETLPEGCSTPESPAEFYAVTDIYPEHIVLDGNHPLAGIALRIKLTIAHIREATVDEIGNGSAGIGFFRLV